jgi:hypothetical protein
MNENMRSVLSAMSVVFMGLSIFCLAMEVHTHTANVAIHVTGDSQATITAVGDSCGGLSAPCGIHPNTYGVYPLDQGIPAAARPLTKQEYIKRYQCKLSESLTILHDKKQKDPGEYLRTLYDGKTFTPFFAPWGWDYYTCIGESDVVLEKTDPNDHAIHVNGVIYGDKIVPGNGSDMVKK